MGSQSEMLRLVDEVTDRYGSLDAFFARLHAEFDDQPTMQLPVIGAAAPEPMAWSAVPETDEPPARGADVASPVRCADEEIGDRRTEIAPTPPRGAAGMWGRLTGRRW